MLVYENKPLMIAGIGMEIERSCTKLEGSYVNNCEVKTAPYKSIDDTFQDTTLCAAELACKILDGSGTKKLLQYILM